MGIRCDLLRLVPSRCDGRTLVRLSEDAMSLRLCGLHRCCGLQFGGPLGTLQNASPPLAGENQALGEGRPAGKMAA